MGLQQSGGQQSSAQQSSATIAVPLTVGGGVIENEWQHFAFRRDAEGNRSIWIDGVNVAEMSTEISPAAMTGEIMFVAEAIIEVPTKVDIEELDDQLDEIGRELTVDIDLVRDAD